MICLGSLKGEEGWSDPLVIREGSLASQHSIQATVWGSKRPMKPAGE